MQCGSHRAANLARRTTADSCHIWISDNHLRQAFTRFENSCNKQSRRHGSNVPGPLEFRRRTSKRRMGMSLHPSHMSYDGGEEAWRWSDLWSILRDDRPEEPRWTWQPATIKAQEKAESEDDAIVAREATLSWNKAAQAQIAQCKTTEDLSSLWDALRPSESQAGAFSAFAFDRALRQLEIAPEDAFDEQWQFMTGFLQSPMHVAGSMSIARLIQHTAGLFSTQTLQDHTLKYVVAMIWDNKVEADELRTVVHTLNSSLTQAISVQRSTAARTAVLTTLRRLKPLHRALRVWLLARVDTEDARKLSDVFLDTFFTSPEHPMLMATLARRIGTWPTELRDRHDQRFEEAVIAYVQDCEGQQLNTKDRIQQICDYAMVQPSFDNWWIGRLASITRRFELEESASGDSRKMDRWLFILRSLQYREQGRTASRKEFRVRLWSELGYLTPDIQLVQKTRTANAARRAQRHVVERQRRASAEYNLGWIKRYVSAGRLEDALRVYWRCEALRFGQCEDLVKALIDYGSNGFWAVRGMLARERVTKGPAPSLSPESVDLVHKAALQLSQADVLYSERQRLRYIWCLYISLQKHGVALSPAMTRALTRAVVTRYLKADMLIRHTLLVRLLELVGRAEGQQVARMIDVAIGDAMHDYQVRRRERRAMPPVPQPRPLRMPKRPRTLTVMKQKKKGFIPWSKVPVINISSFRLRGYHGTYIVKSGTKTTWKAPEAGTPRVFTIKRRR